MPKKVTFKNEKRVCVCLSQEQLSQVEKMAIHMSREEGKIVTISEAIRRAIESCYPAPKQMTFSAD